VIVGQLDQLRERDGQPHANRPKAYRIIYIQSHVRTRQWYKDGETFVWNDGDNNDHAKYRTPKTKWKATAIE